MSAHWPLVGGYPERNFNVLCLIIAGLVNQSTPSRPDLLDDTQSAINVVRHRSDVNPQRLVLFGQSIGGARYSGCYWSGVIVKIRAGSSTPPYSYATIANQMIPGSGYYLMRVTAAKITSPASARSRFYSFTSKADHVIPCSGTVKSCIARQKNQNG